MKKCFFLQAIIAENSKIFVLSDLSVSLDPELPPVHGMHPGKMATVMVFTHTYVQYSIGFCMLNFLSK